MKDKMNNPNRANQTNWSILLLVAAAILLLDFQVIGDLAQQESDNYIGIKAIDANTGEPIQDATVIVWETVGTSFYSRIKSTDSKGEYYIGEAVQDRLYQVYAYKGNLTKGFIEYLPQTVDIRLSYLETHRNVTLKLVPGATVRLTGEISVVESVSPPNTFTVSMIDPKRVGDLPPELNGTFIHVYDRTMRSYLREKGSLDESLVFIPAEIPTILKISFAIYVPERGSVSVSFEIGVDSLSMGEQIQFPLEEYSLKNSIETVRKYVLSAQQQLDSAHSVGFYLAEESMTLNEQQSATNAAREELSKNDPEGYRTSWAILRNAYRKTSNVLTTLSYYVLLSTTNAVYLPAFFAVYSVILAFFLFEEPRKKIASSLLLYTVFIAALFIVYPGTRIIINKDLLLFSYVSVGSIAATLGSVFGITRYWRVGMEGFFTLKDVLVTLFSLGKRQIRVRKSRGFLTLCSLTILTLAFTALTSFGWAYGTTRDKLAYRSEVDGILMRRTGNEMLTYEGKEYPLFIPLDTNYYQKIQQSIEIRDVAPKTETYPTENAFARIISAAGKNVEVFGVLGVEPDSEVRFTGLDGIVVRGNSLGEDDPDGVLLSETASATLNLQLGENVTFVSSEGIALSLTLRGIFSDSRYEELTEIDGQPFGAKRLVEGEGGNALLTLCDATNVVIMNWQATVNLQRQINLHERKEENEIGRYNSLSRIALRSDETEKAVDVIINGLYCDAYVSEGGEVEHHYIGYYYEAKGTVEIVVPLLMSSLSVGAVMLNAVYERRKEMKVLSVIGANPSHLAMVFVSEAIILGMVGGGLGYLFGLGFYRIMPIIGSGLMVREKLEWWWSALGLGFAVLASVVSTLRPALLAVKMYTPSKVRRIKVPEEEKEKRKSEILKVYQARTISLPVKVSPKDVLFFFGFLLGRLKELKTRRHEGILDLEELPETETRTGQLVKTITFNYASFDMNRRIIVRNNIVSGKNPREDYYRVQLVLNLENMEVSEERLQRIAEVIRDIMLDWAEDRERITGTA